MTAIGANGHGPSPNGTSRPWRPVAGRRAVVILAVVVAGIVAAVILGYLRDRGWVRIGTREAIRSGKVVYVSDLQVFVVANGATPVALSALSPHGHERLRFCPPAARFQDQDGDVFDRIGRYVLGPAPRGMDLVAVRVKGDFVDVKPGEVRRGPARGASPPAPTTGPLCPGDAPEVPAGFFHVGSG
jgi:hypothetical protein